MQEINKDKPRRPEFLRILCILSFIGSGLSMVSYGFMYLFFDAWALAYNEGQFEQFIGRLDMEAIELFMEAGGKFFLIQSILFGFSFLGVLYMWKLKKQGFHLYSVSQILILIVQQVFLPSLPFPLIPFLLTLTFILLYYKNLIYMR